MNAITQTRVSANPHEQMPRSEDRLRLRVLAGRSKGAEHSLPPDRRVMIGHSYENDIVLRDPEARGFALYLTPRGKLGELEVVAGRVTVLGRELVAGERIMLEPYVPVRTPSFAFAIGADIAERWDEAQEIAEQASAALRRQCDDVPATNAAERIEIRTQPLRSRYGQKLTSPITMAFVASLLLVAAGGTFFGTSALSLSNPSPQSVHGELMELGLGRLVVERARGPEGASQGLAIVGLVENEDDLLRLKMWATEHHPEIALGVTTVQSAAEAADNLLAAQNIDADVIPAGTNGLLIETEFLPQDRQAELEALLRRDLPRVRNFTFSASASRGQSDLAYFFNAPGFGAASFVSGDPSYIVTEDGTRWFAGASLPTGHKIIEIKGNSVVVERDGLRDTLTM